ncbi:copper resistance CopC family protein [Actinomycetes bacterium M1A6_2h]
MRRAALAVGLIVAMLVLGASPAAAHTRLVASDPVADAVLDAAPTTVRLTFSEALSASFATVSVVGPDGAQYAQPNTTVDGSDAVASTTDAMPAGAYTIGYRVTSADGHPVTGTTSFSLTTAAVPTTTTIEPGAAAAEESAPPAEPGGRGGGVDVVFWILLALLIPAAAFKAGFFMRDKGR